MTAPIIFVYSIALVCLTMIVLYLLFSRAHLFHSYLLKKKEEAVDKTVNKAIGFMSDLRDFKKKEIEKSLATEKNNLAAIRAEIQDLGENSDLSELHTRQQLRKLEIQRIQIEGRIDDWETLGALFKDILGMEPEIRRAIVNSFDQEDE